MSITEARSSLILYNTSGNILIVGKAYSLAAGQRDVSMSPSSGEWDEEKNSGQCAFSLQTANIPLQSQYNFLLVIWQFSLTNLTIYLHAMNWTASASIIQ